MSRTTWRTCSCGCAFRSYTFDRCEDCREGRRASRLAFRRIARDRRALPAKNLRHWQQTREGRP